MKGKNSRCVKIGPRLEEELMRIMEEEKERGKDKTSWRDAGEIFVVETNNFKSKVILTK